MLLIPCPWCGPRDEVEFRYGGEAHIARPPDPDAVDDAAWAEYLFMRQNPKGILAERAAIISIPFRQDHIGFREEGSQVVGHLPHRQGRGPEGMGMHV